MALTVLETIVESLKSTDMGDGGRTIQQHEVVTSRSDLKSVVKEGVVEGLEEHQRRLDEERSDEDDGSSISLTRLMGGAVLLAYLAYMGRKRMQRPRYDESTQERDVPIDAPSESSSPADTESGEY